MEAMNVLSLFDGISCGRLALEKAGIRYGRYLASEIKPHGIKVTQANWPSTEQLGDITKISGKDLPPIGLLFGGSPCQSFSNAGRGEGFDGKSGLFWEWVRLWKETNPKYFLLENVKMRKEWQDIISEELGVQPIAINSNHFVPQNRPRLYWTNIPFSELPPKSEKKLQDVLTDAPESYYLTEKQLSKLDLDYKWSENEIIRHKAGKHQQDNIYRHDGIMCCLSASHHGAARHLTKTYLQDGRIRRLTEDECEALQGVPRGYTEGVSSSDRYELLGDGWTVDVIAHIFSGLKKDTNF